MLVVVVETSEMSLSVPLKDPPPAAAMVIVPSAFVIVTLEPAVRFDDSYRPVVPFPIKTYPAPGTVDVPVPP